VAVEISEKFIPRGEMIVYTKGRLKGQSIDYKSRGSDKNKYLDFPMVVMINDGSASGSEILAGAVQDHNRGVVLGTKSFGKGSVQTVIPLKDGSAMRLTTSRYYTPKGRMIHEKGIVPDVVVEEKEVEEKEVSKAEEVFEKIEDKPKEEKEEVVEEEVEEKETIYDNQLQSAINILKAIKTYTKTEEGA
jgi:carboxyl-terminal processing protease